MRKITPQNSLLIFFLMLIVTVPLAWLTLNKPVRQKSLVEARFLSTFPAPDLQAIKTGVKRILQRKPREEVDILLGKYVDRSFQKNFEAAASDQFPLRLPLILIKRALDRKMIELAYSPLPDPAIPADMVSGIYVLRDKSRLIPAPDSFSDSTATKVSKHMLNIEYLINKYPEISFYALLYERLPGSKHHPLIQYFPQSDQGRIFEYFKDHKPNNLKVTELSYANLDDFSSNNYKTDHHWNIHGALKAYLQIYSIISKDYLNISPLLDIENVFEVPERKFYGSYARRTLYPIEGETFETVNSNFPNFEVIHADDISTKLPWKNYNKIVLSKEKYTNYYGKMFVAQTDGLEFVNEMSNLRNLLVIGNSFADPLLPLLASHYKHTYYIDLRNFKDFSFSDYIKTHQVDDVLLLIDNSVLLNDIWIINP
jgi:hypothetical protein